MILTMVFRLSRFASGFLQIASAIVAGVSVGLAEPVPQSLFWVYITVFGGLVAGVVVHEAGHLLACLALGARVRAVYIDSGKLPAIRFTVRGTQVTVSFPASGRVEYDNPASKGRKALITAAGSAADLIAAGALAAVYGPGQAVALGIALITAALGLSNLLPYRLKTGRLTDGARLLALISDRFVPEFHDPELPGWRRNSPAADRALLALITAANAEREGEQTGTARVSGAQLRPERTNRWLSAYYDRNFMALLAVGVLGWCLCREGRVAELLALHADIPAPAGRYAPQLCQVAHELEWQVLLVPELPAVAVDRAAARVQWLLDNCDFQQVSGLTPEAVRHTLAFARLRQGHPEMLEEVSRPMLANRKLPAQSRATILASIALARQALGLPYEQDLAEAIALAPNADLVPEAARTVPFH